VNWCEVIFYISKVNRNQQRKSCNFLFFFKVIYSFPFPIKNRSPCLFVHENISVKQYMNTWNWFYCVIRFLLLKIHGHINQIEKNQRLNLSISKLVWKSNVSSSIKSSSHIAAILRSTLKMPQRRILSKET